MIDEDSDWDLPLNIGDAVFRFLKIVSLSVFTLLMGFVLYLLVNTVVRGS